MRRLFLIAALALTACSKPEEPTAPAAPREAPINVNQPLDARGTNPAWTLKIRGTQLTFSQSGQPDLVATAPGAVVNPGEAAWAGTLPGGGTMTVRLYASRCAQGPGETKFAYSVEVALPDASPLGGCAGPPVTAPPPAAKP